MNLKGYRSGQCDPGASVLKQLLWWFIGQPVLASSLLPFSFLKVSIMRAFGAKIGQGVRIKPGVKVKYPWRLQVGNYSWIGEGVWIDNLAPVSIGENCCVSQGVYFCTGNHRWDSSGFDLETKAINIQNQVWLAAFSRIAPGVSVEEGVVLGFSSVALNSLESWGIYSGNPAKFVSMRKMQ